jgi:hypothetical protein
MTHLGVEAAFGWSPTDLLGYVRAQRLPGRDPCDISIEIV